MGSYGALRVLRALLAKLGALSQDPIGLPRSLYVRFDVPVSTFEHVKLKVLKGHHTPSSKSAQQGPAKGPMGPMRALSNPTGPPNNASDAEAGS